MIPHTKALIVLKEQISEVYDFLILNCYSVPNLKLTIKRYEKGDINSTIAKPDHFRGTDTFEELKEKSKNYKINLSKYVLLSVFSFFETYIKNSFTEILQFHGGTYSFLNIAKKKNNKSMKINEEEILKCKRKAQEYEKTGCISRYKKYSNQLQKYNFRFPSDLFSHFGIKKFSDLLANMRSSEIPGTLKECLCFEIDNTDEVAFNKIRLERNNIAHGKSNNISLKQTIEDVLFLRKLAIKIDRHIVENFFILEKYLE